MKHSIATVLREGGMGGGTLYIFFFIGKKKQLKKTVKKITGKNPVILQKCLHFKYLTFRDIYIT